MENGKKASGYRLTLNHPSSFLKMAGRLGAAPSRLSFGDSIAQAGARPNIYELVRLPGIAPGHAPWQGAILVLDHNRESKGPEMSLHLRPVPFL